ncbi:MAG TPA: NADAR domain-containing protein, partial [Casimicrobiaceae bacterium]|nr:NADAR domain-containing protein [Casimicrobiaceae bacterium]
EAQRRIIGQASPMTAKMKDKPNRKCSRPVWDRVRVQVMRWWLRVKLAQNWAKFSDLLLRTGDRPIVEESRRDDFWGAKPVDEQTLVGMNVLGRLLMELREAVKMQGHGALCTVEPPEIPEFLLFDLPIGAIGASALPTQDATTAPADIPADRRPVQELAEQTSLFDAPPSAREAPAPAYAAELEFEKAPLADVRSYAALKDSGVPWLGEVPEHWQILPNRAVFTEVKERGHPGADMLSVTITKGVIRQQALLEDTAKKDSSNLDKSAYKLVRPGDIAYNKMRAWQGAIGVSEYEGIVSPAYVVQRPREGAAPRYLHYLLRTPAFAKEAERWSYGITSDMWSLRPEHFKMIYSCLPPVLEQATIVRFLDHADRRIRRYIRAKQKLIKLLEEQKQALIHRAVTRGLDPNVRLKPSGVEWLGDVPEHWEVLPLRRRWSVTDCKHLTVPFVDNVDGIPLASVREVQSFELSLANAKRTTVDSFKSLIEGGRQPRKGDLIYCRNVSVGAAAIVNTDNPLAMGQDVCLIRSSAESQRYLNYFLRSPAMQHQLALLLIGSTFNRINVADIKALAIVVPPREEQDLIVDFLDVELAETSRAQTLATNEISHLREYRTRLIADVVTGKLDVREAAAHLPVEADDSDLMDETEASADGETEGDQDEVGIDAEPTAALDE